MSEDCCVVWNKGIGCFQFPYKERTTGIRKTKAVPRSEARDATCITEAQAWALAAHKFYMMSPKGTWPGKVLTAPHEKKTIQSLNGWWLEYRQEKVDAGENAISTWEQFNSDLKVHILSNPIAELDLEHEEELAFKLIAFFKAMGLSVKAGKFGAGTCQKVAVTLTALFSDAIGERKIKLPGNLSPMEAGIVRKAIPKRAPKGKDDVIVHVPIDDFLKLVSSPAVAPQAIVRYVIEATTGAREGEVAGWTFADFNAKASIPWFRIERQIDTKRRILPPKKGSYRTLPLHPAAVRAFQWWQQEGWAAWTDLGRNPQPNDPVFPDRNGKAYRPHTPRLLRTDLLRAGCPETYEGHPIDAHGLRRTFGTVIGDAGIDLNIREILMGHGSKNVTDRHYTARNLPKFAAHMYRFPLEPGVLALPNTNRLLARAS